MPRINLQNTPASLSFNGTSTQVSIGTHASLATLPLTVIGWVKGGVSTNNQYIYDNTGAGGFAVRINPTGLLAGLVAGAFSTTSGFTYIRPNQWYHFAVSYDGTTMNVYINSVLCGTITNTQTIGSGNIFLGSANGSSYLQGAESNIYQYGSVLTQQQIQAHMSGNPPTGALGQWNLSEGSGTTAYDTSGNGNNGTITSGTYTSDVPFTSRQVVGNNLVYNGNFSFAPPTNVAQTVTNFLDGTSGGSSSNTIFGWQFKSKSGSGSVLFDSTNPYNNSPYSLKVSTTATASQAQAAQAYYQQNSPGNLANTTIPALPSTSYTVGYWMKTVANSGSASTGAILQTVERNGVGALGTGHSNTGVTTTTGWTYYSYTFTTASTCAYLQILPTITGNDGTATLILDAWFSGIFLQKTVLPTRTLVGTTPRTKASNRNLAV